ncbi:hypothetical protein HRD49_01325 [Corallococcus exiguus]|uniref:Secreted protein n=1 Tax=Corallococcus exiguus TaxID=83462 RepID=A0A7Y1RY34_9BACT|nr:MULTISPECIES: hypothetical protein [Corallococcus]RKI47175.1 hypothetical protein D7Y27_06910 [Corallococcus sp. AB004]MBN8466037.1 hypothetical protein [Corallococcus exiguus]NBC40602.1 hypothetical protein [Corallococcus exiguus]NNB85474.1 hypothetical protein [Corallococcus exiguus]NNB93657.1 hypothetical protein [Corallococcus exiguus]
MKKLLAVLALGIAVMATVGLSTRVDARPGSTADEGPTDAQIDAVLDSQAHEVMAKLLEAQRNANRMTMLPR